MTIREVLVGLYVRAFQLLRLFHIRGKTRQTILGADRTKYGGAETFDIEEKLTSEIDQ